MSTQFPWQLMQEIVPVLGAVEVTLVPRVEGLCGESEEEREYIHVYIL